MTRKLLVGMMLLGMSAIILLPAVSVGQPGGGKKSPFGGGGGGMDAGAIFDFASRGKGFIDIASSRSKEQMTQFAKERGITNGQLNKQQYIDFVDYAKTKLTAPTTPGGANPGGGGKGFGKGPEAPPGGGGGFGNPGGGFGTPGGGFGGKGNKGGSDGGGMQNFNTEAVNEWADKEFKKRDSNSDNRLNLEEMNGPLRNSLNRWDKNGDNFIDLQEHRDYFMARLQGEDGNASKGIASIIIEDDEADRKVVVYRAGNLPKNIPSWFKELDTNSDGQVEVMEWRAGKKGLDEFPNWDINDDGYITPEEAMRHMEILAKNGSRSDGSSLSERPSFGKGGDNPWGKKGGDNPWGKKGGDNGSGTESPFGKKGGKKGGGN